MLSIRTGIRPEEVSHQAQHVLFVEGNDANASDPTVLKELFDPPLRIEPLGASFSVKSVAEALYPYHETYYFLIDRDHHDNDFINRCWRNFPDPDTHNLLIWRRREIENYFLEPDYLVQSQYCQRKKDYLEQQILQFANKRLFLDAANHVVISIREDLKTTWIKPFSNPDVFSTKDAALEKLKRTNEFEQHRTNVEKKVSTEEIESRFCKCLEEMTQGQEQLAFGQGDWLDMMRGKRVLAQVINSGSFQVKTSDGTALQGREKINEVVKDLLRQAEDIQPVDFVELKRLITRRIDEMN